jgi:MOSC domain-containing protein YiiM
MSLDLSWRFDGWIDGLPKSPRDTGWVERCVVRTGPGQRSLPGEIELVPGRGVQGDAWGKDKDATPDNQVALINFHLVQALSEGDAQRSALSGDNLQVDLDLSEANLPVGTRLSIGAQTVLVVSPAPHRPCRHFHERYGATAAKRVARANRRGLRGRGVLCTIERGGTIRVGDPIRVERPSSPAPS